MNIFFMYGCSRLSGRPMWVCTRARACVCVCVCVCKRMNVCVCVWGVLSPLSLSLSLSLSSSHSLSRSLARSRARARALYLLVYVYYRTGAPVAFVLFAFFANRADLGMTPPVIRCSGQIMCFLAFLLRLLALASQVRVLLVLTG